MKRFDVEGFTEAGEWADTYIVDNDTGGEYCLFADHEDAVALAVGKAFAVWAAATRCVELDVKED